MEEIENVQGIVPADDFKLDALEIQDEVQLRVLYAHPPTDWIERPTHRFSVSDTRESLNLDDISLAIGTGEFPPMQIAVSNVLLIGNRTIGECLRRSAEAHGNVEYAIRIWTKGLIPTRDYITIHVHFVGDKAPRLTVRVSRHSTVTSLRTTINSKVPIEEMYNLRFGEIQLAPPVVLSEYGIDDGAVVYAKRKYEPCCCCCACC